MKKENPSHKGNLNSLKRIEGQIRGVQRMVEEGKYCVDILYQIHAAIGALTKVEDKILSVHFESCMIEATKGKSDLKRKEKLDEMLAILHKFRKV